MDISPAGVEMGQLAKKRGWKEKWKGSTSLATSDNYHLPRENASYHIVIWHGHLWGGRFQVAMIGPRPPGAPAT